MPVQGFGFRVLIALALAAGATPPWTTASATPGACVQRDTPTLIFPGDPRWTKDQINLGTVGITGTNPRSGNGSLEVTTSGSLADWGFFRRVAVDGGAWGLLSEINCLTFDWWRDKYTLPDPAPPALTAETWQEQTPVLRVLVRDLLNNQFVNSQLVWERWYNTRDALVPTENAQWHYQDVTGQLFWRHFDGGLIYTNQGCINGDFVSSDNLQTFDLNGWVQNCYSQSAQVYGIMIGVGSQWPGDYHGFLDNVQLSFRGQQDFVLADNFELPPTVAPEPATRTLVTTGLAVLAAMGCLTRRRSAG